MPYRAVLLRPLTLRIALSAVLVLLLVITSDAKAQNFPTEPKMEATVDGEGQMRIYWYVPKLEADHAGFALSRAEVVAGSAKEDWQWSPIGDELMRPDLRLDRLKQMKLDKVIEMRPRMKQDIIDLAPEALIAGILEQPAKEYQKLQLAGAFEMQLGIALGTAWIDNDVELGKTYAYRVHTKVHGADGKIVTGKLIGQEQLTYEVNAIKLPKLESFEVKRTKTPKFVKVYWTIKTEALKDREDLRAFNVIAGDLDAPLTTRSTPVSFGTKSEDGKLMLFSVNMRIKSDEQVEIVIQPKGSSGSVGPASEPIVLPKMGGPLGDVKQLKIEVQDGDVVLVWDYYAKEVGDFSGFTVTRKVTSDNDAKFENLVADDLVAPGVRKYIDKGAGTQLAGKRVMYLVRAMSPDSRRDSGAAMEIIEIPSP